jgi:ring-1,2-phenylacetyl-CoA epoxidase subunit PaaA
MRVIAGDGPCNRQRMAHRRRANDNGAWVRQAAAAYAAKRAGGAAVPVGAAAVPVGAAAVHVGAARRPVGAPTPVAGGNQ